MRGVLSPSLLCPSLLWLLNQSTLEPLSSAHRQVPSVGGSVPGFSKVVKTLSIECMVLSEALGQGDFDPDSVKDLGCAPLVPSVGLTLWVGLRH